MYVCMQSLLLRNSLILTPVLEVVGFFISNPKSILQSWGLVAHAFNPQTQETETSLFYRVSSRATQQNLVLTNKQTSNSSNDDNNTLLYKVGY